MNKMFDSITAFKRNLQLWELQLQLNSMTHFPILRKEMLTAAKKYVEEIQLIQLEFTTCFQDICRYEATGNLFSMPFGVNAENVPAKFQV
jgi:hypothetical protein